MLSNFTDHPTTLVHGTKISASAKHSVMVASAEMDVASSARELIVQKLDSMASLPDDLRPELAAACQEACNNRVIAERQIHQAGTLVLVNANSDEYPTLRTVFNRYADGKFDVVSHFGRDMQLAGYSLNLAVFSIEKCYQMGRETAPHIEELVFLAAHTILTA